MISDTGEHAGQPGLSIDVVEPGCGDQAVDDGGAFTAAVRPANSQLLLPSAANQAMSVALWIVHPIRFSHLANPLDDR